KYFASTNRKNCIGNHGQFPQGYLGLSHMQFAYSNFRFNKVEIMKKFNPKNERIKRDYYLYLEEAKRMQSTSVDKAAAAIAEFERFTNYRDFALFHIERA